MLSQIRGNVILRYTPPPRRPRARLPGQGSAGGEQPLPLGCKRLFAPVQALSS